MALASSLINLNVISLSYAFETQTCKFGPGPTILLTSLGEQTDLARGKFWAKMCIPGKE
jgi:hypothetical protein